MPPTNPKLQKGYRFKLTEVDLLKFLESKVHGRQMPHEGAIKENIDVYRERDLEKYFQGSDANVVYVFAKLRRLAKNGKRVVRKVSEDLAWKGNDKAKEVVDPSGRCWGWRKNFSLENNLGEKVGFNMTEFTLHNSLLKNAKQELKDYAICIIKRKSKENAKSTIKNSQEVNLEQHSMFPITAEYVEDDNQIMEMATLCDNNNLHEEVEEKEHDDDEDDGVNLQMEMDSAYGNCTEFGRELARLLLKLNREEGQKIL